MNSTPCKHHSQTGLKSPDLNRPRDCLQVTRSEAGFDSNNVIDELAIAAPKSAAAWRSFICQVGLRSSAPGCRKRSSRVVLSCKAVQGVIAVMHLISAKHSPAAAGPMQQCPCCGHQNVLAGSLYRYDTSPRLQCTEASKSCVQPRSVLPQRHTSTGCCHSLCRAAAAASGSSERQMKICLQTPSIQIISCTSEILAD